MKRVLIIGFFLYYGYTFSQKYEIPFRNDIWILIEGKVNENAERLIFVFDTGASSPVIDKYTAEKLKIKPKYIQATLNSVNNKSFGVAKNQKIEFNDVLFKSILSIIDLSHFKEASGKAIDGIIGNAIISKYTTQVDFDSKVIKLFRKSNNIPDLNTYTKHKVRFIDFKPIVQLSFTLKNNEKIEGDFLFDTGASNSTLIIGSPSVKLYNLEEKIGKTYYINSYGLAEKTSTNLVGNVKHVDISNILFKDIPIRLSKTQYGTLARKDLTGILGLDIISRFNVILDYDNNAIYLKPNSSVNSPFRHNCSGLSYVKKGSQIFVKDVIEGSPAFKAGILVGDEIINVDELTSTDFSKIRNRFQREGETVSLKIKRANNIEVIKFKLTRLID